ncbi:MAG: hypothetical protein ACYTAF_14545, partial [Planctomycetota bacterium]
MREAGKEYTAVLTVQALKKGSSTYGPYVCTMTLQLLKTEKVIGPFEFTFRGMGSNPELGHFVAGCHGDASAAEDLLPSLADRVTGRSVADLLALLDFRPKTEREKAYLLAGRRDFGALAGMKREALEPLLAFLEDWHREETLSAEVADAIRALARAAGPEEEGHLIRQMNDLGLKRRGSDRRRVDLCLAALVEAVGRVGGPAWLLALYEYDGEKEAPLADAVAKARKDLESRLPPARAGGGGADEPRKVRLSVVAESWRDGPADAESWVRSELEKAGIVVVASDVDAVDACLLVWYREIIGEHYSGGGGVYSTEIKCRLQLVRTGGVLRWSRLEMIEATYEPAGVYAEDIEEYLHDGAVREFQHELRSFAPSRFVLETL